MEHIHELVDAIDREGSERMCERPVLHPERRPQQETLLGCLQKVQPGPVLRSGPDLQELKRVNIRGAAKHLNHPLQAEYGPRFFKLSDYECKITPYLN